MGHIWTIGEPYWRMHNCRPIWIAQLLRDGANVVGHNGIGDTREAAIRDARRLLPIVARQTPVRIDLSQHPERWQYLWKRRVWAMLSASAACFVSESRTGDDYYYRLGVYGTGSKSGFTRTLAAAKRAAERAAASMEKGE